ncbi:MAG: isocitrate lyase/phosphoenolpyruvate mutase family protein [Alphaproteobacteria bacterium]
MTSLDEKRLSFRRLHEHGCFVMPNPWDLGSAKYLQSLGFKAVATTSAGLAWSRGTDDGRITREIVLAHVAELSAAVDIPLNVDFEAGFGTNANAVAESVRLCALAGASGLSIEDCPGPAAKGLYPLDEAVARLKAARAAIDAAGGNVVLTGRSEGFIRGAPDLPETVRRLKAYAAAGADCLYAPGIRTTEEIKAVVEAVAPKPVNVLIGWPSDLTVADLAGLGVRRISVGGALARSAWGGLINMAREIAEQGSFKGFANAAQGADIVKGLR